MNFTSGGTIEGTISSTPPAPPPSAQPQKPPGIPAHYVFDEEVELWMPPSAIAKAAAVALVQKGPSSGITVIKSGDSNPAPYIGSSNDPICFEFTNTGVCSRLNSGQICRYRHLQADHPDVIADKVRQGKLPPSVLESGLAPAESGIPPDPGQGAQLCFDFINSGKCARLASGAGCKYRHLPQGHPEVIADKVRQGKISPAMAAQLLSGIAGGGAAGLAALGTPGAMTPGAGLQAAALQQAGLGGAADASTAMALAASIPDPGPGVQLCFDFINKGACSRLARGDICRYRHLLPNHPDVIADKVRQGKAPGAMPTPPMGNYTEHLALQGAAAQLAANMAAQADAPRGSGGGGDDSGERFRQRDRLRRERSDGYGRGADVDRHGYERHERHEPDRDRREREREHDWRGHERRERGREREDYYYYERREERRDERRDRDRGRYDDRYDERRHDERRDERRGGDRYDDRRYDDDRRYGDRRRDDERDGRRWRDDDARRDYGGAGAMPDVPPRGGDPPRGGEA